MTRSALLPVLTIAGSDPTGGAGVQGDLKTFAAHGVYGQAVVAAITVQNASGVSEVEGVEPRLVAAQLEALLDQSRPLATKTGMLYLPETVRAVAAVLRRRPAGPLVVDPVLRASAGGSLSTAGLLEALAAELLPLAALVTPNLDEAAALLRRGPIDDAGMVDAAVALLDLGSDAVLLKGGHARGPATDVLATSGGDLLRMTSERVRTPHGHGSGCALSAAIVARLARGESLATAVGAAKAYVRRAIEAATGLGVGRGPVRHDVPA